MDTKNKLETEIERVTGLIASDPENAVYYMERGKLYRSAGINDKALNDFLQVRRIDPSNAEAREHEKQLREIFEFRFLDYYNP